MARSLLEEFNKLFNRQPGIPDQASQRAPGYFLVVRNRDVTMKTSIRLRMMWLPLLWFTSYPILRNAETTSAPETTGNLPLIPLSS